MPIILDMRGSLGGVVALSPGAASGRPGAVGAQLIGRQVQIEESPEHVKPRKTSRRLGTPR